MADLMVFTGKSNPELAQKTTEKLGIPLGDAAVTRFSDGEICIEINENVRGRDVFVMQSTCAPTNDNIMELLFIVDPYLFRYPDAVSAALSVGKCKGIGKHIIKLCNSFRRKQITIKAIK